MLVAPDTTICAANSEPVSLGLSVETPMAAVRLLPLYGEVASISLSDGSFILPLLHSPNAVKVEWLAEGSTEADFVTYVDVVSRHYFTLDQLKSYDDGRDEFGQLDDDVLMMARQAATEVIEQNARRSFVERIGRTIDYLADDLVTLPHGDVTEIITDGYRLVSDCQAERTDSPGSPRRIEYVYGTGIVPAEIARAALELAAYTLRPSNRPIGATGESTDAGYIHFTTAGRDGATAIPEVNAAIEQFGRGHGYVW